MALAMRLCCYMDAKHFSIRTCRAQTQPMRVLVHRDTGFARHAQCKTHVHVIVCNAINASTSPASQVSIPDNQYFSWATKNGINADKLALATFAGGLRGVKATDSIPAGATLVTVPRNMALMVSPQMKCPFPEFVDAQYWQRCPWFVKMALLVLWEKRQGGASTVVGYMQHLPEQLDLPLQWCDADLQQLQYPALQSEVQQQRQRWQEFHQQLEAALQAGHSVSYDDFVWALGAVRSRCFSGPYSGPPLSSKLKVAGPAALLAVAYVATQHIPLEQALNGAIAVLLFNLLYDILLSQKLKWYAMCPVIDSMNHVHTSRNTVAYEYFRDTFSVTAEDPVAQGNQVYITYGPQSNDSLLQYYGFVEADNPNDTYVVLHCAEKLKLPAAAVQQLQQQQPEHAASLQSFVLTPKGPTAESLQALRMVLGGGEADELQALQAVQQLLEQEVQQLPSTLAADQQVLKDGRRTLEGRQQLAVEFRVQKKLLLHRCTQRVAKRCAKLQKKQSLGAVA